MKRRPFSSIRAANIAVAAILALVPVHAFLAVWGSTFAGHFTLLRLWDELLLGILALIAGWWLLRDATLRRQLWQSVMMRLTGLYVLLVLLLGVTAYAWHAVSLTALGYGLVIDARFLVWFVCVWAVATKSPWLYEHWRRLAFIPLAAVTVFGLLQFIVLPYDFLSHFGYGAQTYTPYVTINQDTPVIRVQSFLRGANPLGAYLAAMVGVLMGCVAAGKKNWWRWLLLILCAAALVASFSRSGWIGALIAVGVAIALRLHSRRQWMFACAGVMVLVIITVSTLFVFRGSRPVQDALLHVDDSSTAVQTSNEQHAYSFSESVSAIIHEPLGGGTGTSGQASWYNRGHQIRNTESYLLQIGEELGWFGLALFLSVLLAVGRELWQRRQNALALGLLAGLAGITAVSLFSYAWADDSLAFVWWGLAGIACALPRRKDT